MSDARLHANGVHRLPLSPSPSGWFKLVRHRLSRYRALLRERHVWVIIIQLSVISAAHTILETALHLPAFGVLYFVPSTSFLVPVIYAALTFGLRGALITSLTATVITIPNWVLLHESWETLGCISQLFVVDVAAYFIGKQVDRVKSAQHRTEAIGVALKASETRYRSLFDSSPIAILVLGASGIILDANPTAGVLFSRAAETLKGMSVANLIGTVDAQKLLSSYRNSQQPESLVLEPLDGVELYIEPTLVEADDGQGNSSIQVLLKDVTKGQRQQAGLRAYAAHVLRVLEEERQRIARELHDGAVQQLILLHRQLGSLQTTSTSGTMPSLLVGKLQEAGETTQEVIRELRDFARALRPPILEDLGLVASLRSSLSDLTKRAGLQAQMKMVGNPRPLPSDIELHMFRIAQEALRNVERHAKATQVVVTITFAEHEVSLDVLDNGMGFIVPPTEDDFVTSSELGLITMQERAKLLDGKLEVRSSPGGGTRVIVSVPLQTSVSESNSASP